MADPRAGSGLPFTSVHPVTGVDHRVRTGPPGRSHQRSPVLKFTGAPRSSVKTRAVTRWPPSSSVMSKEVSPAGAHDTGRASSMDGAKNTASLR